MEKRIATLAIIYFVIGIFFAIAFSLFYHWPRLSFFSPGFYVVVLTWPIQIPGFFFDFQIYGFTGKILI
ncbi:MAG: hypothetical protein V1808_03195 [Candidatus Daviesbacteria bacterium]